MIHRTLLYERLLKIVLVSVYFIKPDKILAQAYDRMWIETLVNCNPPDLYVGKKKTRYVKF